MPDWKQEIRQRLAVLKLAPARESEIVEELSLHLEDRYEELRAGGATDEEAFHAAMAELIENDLFQQGLQRVERQVTQDPVVLGGGRRTMIGDLWQDIRFGIRMMGKHPGFTAVVVLTLALGIGVNTAIFSFLNMFLRPFPIKDPGAVAQINFEGLWGGGSYLNYLYLRDNTQVFSDLIARHQARVLEARSDSEDPEEIRGEFVSDNFFSALGGRNLLGRTFRPEENLVPGKDPVVVLSHHFWQRRFAGDPDVVRRTMMLGGKPFTVIGVMDRDFVGLRIEIPDLWFPLVMRGEIEPSRAEKADWFGKRSFEWLSLTGRLKPERTQEEAQAEMQLLLSQLARAYPELKSQAGVRVVLLARQKWDDGQRSLVLVLAATGLVLLIACSNIANLLLARAAARQKEIGIRLCLGASRGRMIRQLLTESFLLAGLGGVTGLLAAWWSLELLIATMMARWTVGRHPNSFALDFSPDIRILGFTLLLSLASGIAFGLAPALRATGADLVATIKDEGAAFGQRIARSWLRNGLVVAQVALCLVLLLPAGLLLRGLVHALTTDPGFEAKRLLVVRYSLELSGYDEPRAQLFNQQLLARLASLPGVESVSADGIWGGGASVTLPGERETAEKQFAGAEYLGVAPGYFETAGIPIVSGRGFTAEEVRSQAPVVVVSEATARNLWPNENPLGKTLQRKKLKLDSSWLIFPAEQVIGVVPDAREWRQSKLPGEIPPLFLYLPQAPSEWMRSSLLVRVSRDAREMKPLVRAEARSLAPNLRLWQDSMEEIIASSWRVLSARVGSDLTASAFAWRWARATRTCCNWSSARACGCSSSALSWVWRAVRRSPGCFRRCYSV